MFFVTRVADALRFEICDLRSEIFKVQARTSS